jgi:hypothetical protein
VRAVRSSCKAGDSSINLRIKNYFIEDRQVSPQDCQRLEKIINRSSPTCTSSVDNRVLKFSTKTRTRRASNPLSINTCAGYKFLPQRRSSLEVQAVENSQAILFVPYVREHIVGNFGICRRSGISPPTKPFVLTASCWNSDCHSLSVSSDSVGR